MDTTTLTLPFLRSLMTTLITTPRRSVRCDTNPAASLVHACVLCQVNIGWQGTVCVHAKVWNMLHQHFAPVHVCKVRAASCDFRNTPSSIGKQ